jgi:hypothetical protein
MKEEAMAKKKSKISKAEELLKARESDKLKMMREYARLQKLRSTVGGSETTPKVTLPRFSWDEKNYDEGKRLDDRGDNLDGN